MDVKIVPKTDVINYGPTGGYDDKDKPICPTHGGTWVVSVGNNREWVWKCTNCQTEFTPDLRAREALAAIEKLEGK